MDETTHSATTGTAVRQGSESRLWQLAGEQAAKPYMPMKHRMRGVVAAVLLVLVAWFVYVLAVNPNIKWDIVGQYIFAAPILEGLYMTIQLTVISMLMAIGTGLIVAIWALSGNPVLRSISAAWIWFFRGVPLLVQILVWGNFALLFPRLSLGVPGTDLTLFDVSTNTVVTAFVASILGLGLHEGAYMAEIIRGGIVSVGKGQKEAGYALGLNGSQTMRKIVLPQSMRLIIPATGNQFVSTLKASALVSVIAGGDLLTAAEVISAFNYATLELLFVATFWYLVVVTVFSFGQSRLERRLAKGRGR